MAVDYYFNRPVKIEEAKAHLEDYADKVVSDWMRGGTGAISMFLQTFGPAGTAVFINEQIKREGDKISVRDNTIAGIDFTNETLVKALVIDAVLALLTPALVAAAAGPVVYIAAGTLAVAAGIWIWNNIAEPVFTDAKAYLGFAPARIDLTTSDGTLSGGARYSTGLAGF